MDYLEGVVATLAWTLGQRPESPVTHTQPAKLTTRDLKAERLRAEDVIEQASQPWLADRLPPLHTAKASSSPSPGCSATRLRHLSTLQGTNNRDN